ncbi:uncharacterized protein [Spinacia oleracea]|uniref:Uncharacterized protein isoform X2 n=1 Tax=Spinacia oleracea TaxID=3562 RepID=A0ABM3RCE1_SPIOL|nr:uncharacterized protein LOC130468006 isoform X2 [Spinacia oleracea]
MEKKGLPKGLALGSCNVLETAGLGAFAPLHQTLPSAINRNDSELPNSGTVIWVCRDRIIQEEFNSLSLSKLQKYLTDEEYSFAQVFFWEICFLSLLQYGSWVLYLVARCRPIWC